MGMTDEEVMMDVIKAGVRVARHQKGAGIASAWLENLRPFIRVVRGDHAVKTLAVNAEGVFINADWCSAGPHGPALTQGNWEFLLGHETLHIAFGHRVSADRNVNIAQDAIINHLLVQDGIGEFPQGPRRGILLADFQAQGYTGPAESESLYRWLGTRNPPTQNPPPGGKPPQGNQPGNMPGNQPGQPGNSPGGKPGDKPFNGCAPSGVPGTAPKDGSPARDPRRVEMQSATALREESARCGVGTAIGEAFKVKERKANIRKVLRRAFEDASATARSRELQSYSRVSRRGSMDPSIVRPGRVGTTAKIALVGDVSGSLGSEGVASLVGYLQSVAKEFPEVSAYLVTHTDAVCFKGYLKAGGDKDAMTRAATHTGGTDFKPAYRAVEEAGRFDVMVHFTDGIISGAWPASPAKNLVVALWGDAKARVPANARVVPVEVTGE